jgi:hypothetical protein
VGVPSPPPTPQQKRFQYFLGLGLGFIPLILFFIGFAPNIGVLIIISLILYVVVLIATIVCTIIESVRSVGYGLLTAFLVSPFVAAIGCIVIISQRTA